MTIEPLQSILVTGPRLGDIAAASAPRQSAVEPTPGPAPEQNGRVEISSQARQASANSEESSQSPSEETAETIRSNRIKRALDIYDRIDQASQQRVDVGTDSSQQQESHSADSAGPVETLFRLQRLKAFAGRA